MDLKDFIAASLTQIVEGVAQSAKAISDAGGAVSPAFSPSNLTERMGVTSDGNKTPVYAVSFDVAVVASSSDTLEGGARLSVASMFSAGGKMTGSEKEEVTSRIKFMIPLRLPTDPISLLAKEEHERQKQAEVDRVTRMIHGN